MSSGTVAPVVGSQVPRLSRVPEYVSSRGREAVELAALAGLYLDPWQQLVLEGALGETAQEKWAAFHVALVVGRQNGKGSILEARELAGLFLFDEQLIIHSAHEQVTASEHFQRMLALIDGVPEFSSRCLKPVHGKGSEAIRLRSGGRMLFKTRTANGGRGLTGDLVVLDEAMMLADAQVNTLLPTMAARSKHGNPQIWYTGSAVDQQDGKMDGVPFSRARARALEGRPRRALYEWSLDFESPDLVPDDVAMDPSAWAQATPGLEIRITPGFIEDERDGMSARGFAVERLGVGDWPSPDGEQASILKYPAWTRLQDETSQLDGVPCLAFDTSPDRAWSSISICGRRADGKQHAEPVARRPGTGWVVDEVARVALAHNIETIICDAASPAASLIPELKRKGIHVQALQAREYANSCGEFFDAVQQDNLRHRGEPELHAALNSAVRGATTRTLGDAWAWSRRSSAVDITPLVALTLAYYGAVNVDETEFVFEVFG